jgi:hypothetical protein
MVESNLAFDTVSNGALLCLWFSCFVITSVDTYFHASYNKIKEHQHLWKFLVITLILLLMILLHLFYSGIDGIKVVLNSHQQLPHT